MAFKQYLSPKYFAIIWMWFALTLVSLVVGVLALRQNNLNMIVLRDAVIKADEQNGDVEGALQTLRSYVYSHMNTNTATANGIRPSIQLKYRYDRLVAAEQEKVKSSNEKIYNDAQNYCEKLHPEGLSGRTRVPCISEYVTSHGVQEQVIQDAQYKFDFVSPRWSPDTPGLALLLSGFFFVLFVLGFWLEFRHTRNTGR